MTMWMQFEPIRTEAEMRQRARRNSYLHRPIPRVKDTPPVVKEVAVQLREPKESVRVPVDADAHVIAWRAQVKIVSGRLTATDYVRARCDVLGVLFSIITGPSRRQEVRKVRDLLMWEVHQRFPHMSLPQIGAVFGKEHTSVYHSLKKHGYKPTDRKPLSESTVAAILNMLEAGMQMKEIGRQLGVSGTTVARYRSPDDYRTRRKYKGGMVL